MGERSDFCGRIIHVEYVIGQVVLSTLILSNSIHQCLLGHINHYKSSPTTNQNILCSVMLTVAVTQQYFTYTHNTLLIISFVCLFWGQVCNRIKTRSCHQDRYEGSKGVTSVYCWNNLFLSTNT